MFSEYEIKYRVLSKVVEKSGAVEVTMKKAPINLNLSEKLVKI